MIAALEHHAPGPFYFRRRRDGILPSVPDDMAPEMRETLDLLWVTARDAFGHRRGSPDAQEYAGKVERAYGSDSDARVRREIAEICEFLRNPVAAVD